MHANANIAFQLQESSRLLAGVLATQPRTWVTLLGPAARIMRSLMM